MAGGDGQRGGIEGSRFEGSLGRVVFRVDNDVAVCSGRDAGESGKADGRGHDKAFGIVSVLANQVHASGCGKNCGLGVKAFKVHGAEQGNVVHVR